MKHAWTLFVSMSIYFSLNTAHADTAHTTITLQSMKDLQPMHTGMNMEHIVQNLGQPKQKYQPVGEPPITRWQYENHTVYFENNTVIHTVQHQPQQ